MLASRQLAFLHTVPEGHDKPRIDAGGYGFAPVPDAAAHIWEAFLEFGCAAPSGVGLGALPFAEIAAGAPWATLRERKALRQMSRAYVAERERAKNEFALPPWEGSR